MDEWRMQQQQQHRMLSGGIGPVLGYQSLRTRSSPYPSPHQMSELKQSYSYSQTPSNPLSPSPANTPNSSSTPIPLVNDTNDATSLPLDDLSNPTSNSDVYTPNSTSMNYTAAQMEQIQQQQQQQQQSHMMPVKSASGPMVGYNPAQQQMMAARARAMPYQIPTPGSSHHHPQQHPHHPHPSMYPHGNAPVCQCPQHMHGGHGHYPMHANTHPMYYQQQQQQQNEAWFRYQQQQQQAAWRQQMQQHHMQPQHQPVPIEPNYPPMMSESSSGGKMKTTKSKVKKKLTTSASLPTEEMILKHQTIQGRIPGPIPQQRLCIPPTPAMYQPSLYSTSHSNQPAQQLPPPSSVMPQEHPMYTQTSPSTISHHQSQMFTSPLSNPGTPHQLHSNGEFNGSAEFGVPYHQAAPGSVNSLTDALCPSGDPTDRQMTPGPPSVGTPRVAPHQYSFPHTPLTPQTINGPGTAPQTPMMPPTPNPLSAPPTPLTRPRSSSEQTQSTSNNMYQTYEQTKPMNNIDDLTAYLKDPTNIYLTDDVTATLFDDIDALADTYLGQQSTSQQATNVDNNSAEDIFLKFLCSDDVTA